MKRMTSLVGKSFTPAKCKTQLRLGSSRIKLLRNKKIQQIAADSKAVADFLRNGHESNARIRVEHIIREQNLLEAYDLLFLYAERIVAQLSVIDSQKTCPGDLKEDISTLLYASSRCSELPDFAQIRPMFSNKYGKEFVTTIEELRPGCGVNGKVIEKLSVSRPSGEAKLQLMKSIAVEHNVDWDPASFEKELRADSQDLLDGPSKIICVEDLNEFPTVPSQKPTLNQSTQSDHFANSGTSGRFTEDEVERKNSPRPGTGDDFRTSSQNGRAGPPKRKPPGRPAEDPPFDSPDATEALPRRSSRRESDILPAPSRYQEEESRRNSIGVPREKNGRVNSAPVSGGVDEEDFSPPREYSSRHSRRGSIDELDGSHRPERRQSQKYDGKKHSSEEDEHGVLAKSRPGADAGRRNLEGSGSGKSRSHKQDADCDEDHLRRVPSREKARDQESGELRKARSREGSGKGRTHHGGEYVDEPNLRRASSKDGSGSKIHPSSGEEGRRSKEGSQGKYRRHEYSDEDADHVREPTRQMDSGKHAHKLHVDDDVDDPDYDSERFKNSVNTRTLRNTEVEYRDSPRGTRRESQSWKAGVPEDEYRDAPRGTRHESQNWKAGVREDEYRDSPRGTRHESQNWKAGVPEDEYRESSRGTRRESQNWKAGVREDEYRDSPRGTRHESQNWKAGVLEDEYRESSRRTRPDTHNLESPRGDYSPRAGHDFGRRPQADDTIPVKRYSNLSVPGRRENERSETLHNDSSEYEHDPRGGSRKNNFHTADRSSDSGEEGSFRSRQRKDAQEGSFKGRQSGREDPAPRTGPRYDSDESLHTSSRTDKRMSLPGEQKFRPSDAYDDIGRRATLGPAEIGRGARESEDILRREKQKQSSQRDSDDRPPRFLTPKVDERPERPRKKVPAAEYDDANPPPRFIKVGKQDDPISSKSSTSSTPRPGRPAPLQSYKTDPELPKTPKATTPALRRSATEPEQPPVPPPLKVPDLDHFLSIFADSKGGKGKAKGKR